MGEIRELIRDYMSPFNQNMFFKALNIIDIYNLNAIFRQPRPTLIFCAARTGIAYAIPCARGTQSSAYLTIL